MSQEKTVVQKEAEEARSPLTSMSRLVELCRSSDLVVRMIAVTHPKIQHYGSEALDPEKYSFFLKVDKWLLDQEDI
tara:strand:- start:8872 stop:9099 length:228 start_codon:yes stop_codon:yes gene_type:complete